MLDHDIMSFLHHIIKNNEIGLIRGIITSFFQHFGCILMISIGGDAYEGLQKFMVGSVQ